MSQLTEKFDVVIIGGAMMGSAIAWFLCNNKDFTGKICVVEQDPSYEFAATSRTNSCIRQQFSKEINIKISQFGVKFIKNFKSMIGDETAPEIKLDSYGYMFLSDTDIGAEVLKENQIMQSECGVGTSILLPEEIKNKFPFYNVSDLVCGSHNTVNEGYFDGATIFNWWLKTCRKFGVEFITDEVISMEVNSVGTSISNINLASGRKIICGTVVNASGTRASVVAKMINIAIPVEPRRRYSFVFDAEKTLDGPLPLTIDPSGVHFRSDGQYYLAGCPPENDQPPDLNDFEIDHGVWENKIWPALINRIPQFDALKVINSWVGHYDYNVLDQNAILGYHPHVKNFIFANGFSGHGLQQSPAIGRGISELIAYGEYRSLNLSDFSYDRIIKNEPFLERAII